MPVTTTNPPERGVARPTRERPDAASKFAKLLPADLRVPKINFSGLSPLTKRLLIATAMIAGIIAISYMLGIPQWMKQRRETHQWVVSNKLTPDSLIARCGRPLSDDTKDLYPMVARDMSYKSATGSTVLMKFSRTAEEGSDWVFMSMQDASTGASYDTPVAKISALGCLDSSK